MFLLEFEGVFNLLDISWTYCVIMFYSFQCWRVQDHFALQSSAFHCQERQNVEYCGGHLPISC